MSTTYLSSKPRTFAEVAADLRYEEGLISEAGADLAAVATQDLMHAAGFEQAAGTPGDIAEAQRRLSEAQARHSAFTREAEALLRAGAPVGSRLNKS